MAGCKTFIRSIEPIWSVDKDEARRRVIKLYKTWFRQIPFIVEDYKLPKTKEQCQMKLHDEFWKNKEIRDIKTIDTLALRGQIELKEITCLQKSRSQIIAYWSNDSDEPNQTEFFAKFLVGKN